MIQEHSKKLRKFSWGEKCQCILVFLQFLDIIILLNIYNWLSEESPSYTSNKGTFVDGVSYLFEQMFVQGNP